MGSIKDLVTETSIPRCKNLIETLFCKSDKTEETNGRIEWTWETPEANDFVNLLNDDKDVKFHRNFSSGTAVVRGAQPMTHDQYFWELKMISPVYGTDMMIGVGTPEASMTQVHDKFISLLGSDKQTWGLSYTGLFHHNGESKSYASRFGQGCTIGVHLDLWNGTLSFYKNKKHLGIASRGLTGKTLYAMASSTAACSGMRIVRSCSFPSSLQFLCCAKLRELIPDEKSVLSTVKMPPGLKVFLENNLGWLLDSRFTECVLYPSLSKRKLHSALKANSDDPLLGNVGSEDEEGYQRQMDGDEEGGYIWIGERPFLLQCTQRMGRLPPPRLGPYGCLRRNAINLLTPAPSESTAAIIFPRSDPRSFMNPRNILGEPIDEVQRRLSEQASSESPADTPISLGGNLLMTPTRILTGQTSSESRIVPPPPPVTIDDCLMVGLMDVTDGEEDDSLDLEKPAKRPRTYNYIVGLSDSEGEDGAAV
ncbi:hypothetical protein JTE90_024801 [Oedothorax gibbosus]|uniref:B30.2/SPRY domain-containing protein n=1 Tax=Oedothorax gibbosus TaxID=931172 RepID=A0AAV6TXX8_9ARAC|nr:hypothetical protein JTE90_024801 [Oedothorax gibbosus]